MSNDVGPIRSAFIEMRSHPYVFGTSEGEKMYVDDALVTVTDPGDSQLYQRGMVIKIARSEVTARHLDVRTTKYCGSQNHHKFTVMAQSMHFAMRNGGMAL